MKKWCVLLSLIVIAGAVLFNRRHHQFRQLQTEHSNLQAQASLASPLGPVQTTTTNSVSEKLSAEEHSELLRLRGQVGQLRQELTQESNQLAVVSNPRRPASGSADERIVSPVDAQRRQAVGRQLMIAMLMYANDNGGQLPVAMTNAALYMGPARTNDEFELVRNGPLSVTNEPPSRTIALREKKPWKGVNGRWNRTYVFVDGHSEIAKSDTPDFSEWEEKLKRR